MSNRNHYALLDAGERAQLEKLEANDHKGGWGEIPLNELAASCSIEVWELTDELLKEPIDYEKVRAEAADVANYAHMIIQRCDKMLEEQSGG